MLYLALGAAALVLLVLAGRRSVRLQRREWRLLSAAAALAAFAGAASLAVRGGWAPAVGLILLGLWLAVSARRTGAASNPPPAPPPQNRMSADEARRILGVEASATRTEIQDAHMRLMRTAHPDKGGTAGLAALLNAARDRLLEP